MAENQEQTKPKEREIPVFTVLRNNCILKNIFLVYTPPSISSSPSPENVGQESEMEEVLMVGRHPDCDINLNHPSISRFHLRIHSKPSSRSLFVTDLSSVHGTWVSGKRIESGLRIKLNEGDTLHLGASSRLYRLNWVPLSCAYDTNDSFIPQLDASDTADEETEGQGLSDNVESLERLLSDENRDLSMQKMSPMAPPMPEELYHHPTPDEDEVENICLPEICNKENELSSSQLSELDSSFTVEEETEGATDQVNEEGEGLGDDMEGLEQLFSDENLVLSMQKATAPPMPETLYRSFSEKDEISNSSPEILNKGDEFSEKGNSTPQTYIPPAASQTASHSETKEYSGMNSVKGSGLSIWSRRGKPKSVKVETSQSRSNCSRVNMSLQVESLTKENCLSEPMLKDQYDSPDNDDETFTPDKENASPDSYLVRSLKSKFEDALKYGESISNTPISSVDQEEEIFTPDKENVTPSSHLLRSMKNIGKSREVKHPSSFRPSPLKIAAINGNMCQDEVLVPALDGASQNQKVLQESRLAFSISENHGSLKKQQPVLKARTDRKLFQPLLVNSTSDHKTNSILSVQPLVHESTRRECKSINYLQSKDINQSHNNTKVSKNRWTIVADTTCLLNRKSRKELQLLRGLRGTTLVIPRIVVRELDCMVKRASFFSKMTDASAALNWIEECMAATKWWIHVQSSAEEAGKLVPPTPPAASPRWFSDSMNGGSNPFSPCSLQEIITPTAADHILESALLFRRTRNGQLVLLSDDVALKIKAMAEGVACETAEEFRRSLVNPFSTRFLYSDSSPLGPTWLSSEDMVLKEHYYPSPNSKSGEGGAKGLKLILLHNSSFRQMRI